MYGSDAPAVRRLEEREPAWAEPLHPALPYTAAELVRAAREEMALTLEDALARRTRGLFLNARAALETAPRAVDLPARELGRDEAWKADQLALLRAAARHYLPA